MLLFVWMGNGFWSLNVNKDVMSNEYRYKGDRALCHVIFIMFGI